MEKDSGNQLFKDILGRLQFIEFKGEDISDLFSSTLYLNLNSLKKVPLVGKYLYHPFFRLAKSNRDGMVKLFNARSNQCYPQAHALIIRALMTKHKLENNTEYLNLAESLANDLISMRSKTFSNYCWGQPYNWPSAKHIMKADTPRATVSSQAAMAFLDLYELTNNKKYLDIATSVCEFYIQDLNRHKDEDGDVCFAYTTEDNYIIHNASMLAAAVLLRTWSYTKIEEFRDFGKRASSFTAKHQNPNGSWYYRAKPDKIKGVIDNYHTGFVIESYLDIRDYAPSEYSYHNEVDLGLDFYHTNFFTEEYAPKMRDSKIYPIDIQSCAQSILTFVRSEKTEYKQLAEKVLNYTLSNLYDEKQKAFYYQIHANNKLDKNSFIRWGDSWMLRAIAQMLKSNQKLVLTKSS